MQDRSPSDCVCCTVSDERGLCLTRSLLYMQHVRQIPRRAVSRSATHGALHRPVVQKPRQSAIVKDRGRVRQRQGESFAEVGMHLLVRVLKKISTFSKNQKTLEIV
ncbi:hypothetical protein L798_14219 [Zootermopsis nevadensis]|uniref:Uncharacterized protein n=1 Tax=Zootermopsis nevadensis TaxID=136037 RepID=A0A067RTE0_ZOONE|nr:hypothetical protein L798_14219 [Zootermopsis nevadensis]